MTDETDSWAKQLQAALIAPVDGNEEVDSKAKQRAEAFVKRAKLLMGTGIDPAAVLNSLEGYAEAIRNDPTCVNAYLGLGKAAQFLANRRPAEAVDLLGPTLRWLVHSSKAVGRLQENAEIHALEFRLRDARRIAHGRPKPIGEAVHVQLERDDEGRVLPLGGRRIRFRPDSGELPALIPGLPIPPSKTGQRIPAWIPITAIFLFILGCTNIYLDKWHPLLNGLIVGGGLVVLSLPFLVWSGRWTKGIAPTVLTILAFAACIVAADQLQVREAPPTLSAIRFDERLGPLYPSLRPLLRVGAPDDPRFKLSKLAVVEETGDSQHPLQTDALHDRLPQDLRANTPDEVRTIIIVRRMSGKAQHMILLWALDPNDRKVLARTALSGSKSSLEFEALEWILRLRH